MGSVANYMYDLVLARVTVPVALLYRMAVLRMVMPYLSSTQNQHETPCPFIDSIATKPPRLRQIRGTHALDIVVYVSVKWKNALGGVDGELLAVSGRRLKLQTGYALPAAFAFSPPS